MRTIKPAVALLCAIILGSCGKTICVEDPVEHFRIKTNTAALYKGDSRVLSIETTTDKPESADAKYSLYSMTANRLGISFLSRNEKTVSVTSTGRVSCLNLGEAWVVAQSEITGQKDSILIKVNARDANEAAFAKADLGWKPLAHGGEYGYVQMNLFDAIQSISIVRYPEGAYSTTLVYYSGNDCKTVPNAAAAVNADMAINASFFNTTSLVASTTMTMNGILYASSSANEANTRSTGMLLIKDGKIDFSPYDASQLDSYRNNYDATIASGPLLRYRNSTMSFADRDFNNLRHPRTMIGVTNDRTVYMVVVDGRFTGNAAGMTIAEMERLAYYLDLVDALNLDGGGSSTIWTKEAGVMNYPCDNSKWDHAGCRRTPTVIVAKAK